MMQPAEIERKAFDLMATSIRDFSFVENWKVNGKDVKLPFICDADPDDTFRLETEVEVPDDGLTWFIKVSMEGNGLLKVDGESYAGIDDVHTYVPLKPGKHSIVIEATPLTMFGYHKWRFCLEYAILVGILWEPYSLAQRLLDIVSFVEEIKEDDLKNAIMKEMSSILIKVRSVPSVTQVTLLRMLLYDGGLGIRELKIGRFDVREVRPDYMFLSAVYGLGILKGKMEDILKPERHFYLEEIERVEKELDSALNRLRTEFPKIGKAYAFGHAHIDAAWLWRYRETKRKVMRTISTTVRLLEKYDASFAQSSSQYYAWIEEEDPELFKKLKELVFEGKIIPVGGMWVESDVQLVSGESLVRQFLYGQRYLLEKFGRIARIGWLPDTFGFAASLPQILVKSGIEVFTTYKILWNERNEFPYHAFIWKGVDGSEIPAHIMMSYKSSMTAKSLYKQWKTYKNRHDVPMIYVYGYGDGGGGITWEMVEMQKHMNELPYIPYVLRGVEDEYIKEVSERVNQTWEGELYVEAHRGTYTTNIRMKELMARAESVLRSAEVWSCIAEMMGFRQEEKIEDLWKKVLLHQFHDVLPGSSIKEVYDDANMDLEYVISKAEGIIERSVKFIAEKEGMKKAVFNDLPWERKEVVDVNGREMLVKVPPLGWCSGCDEEGAGDKDERGGECGENDESVSIHVEDGKIVLENEHLLAVLNESGELISLYDKDAGREALKSRSNVLIAHIDTPGMWDAWDVNEDFLLQGRELECDGYEIFERKLCCGVKFYRRYENSKLVQTVKLKAGSKLLEFDTDVDWYDKEILLKTWFNFNVHNWTSFYEVPYGVVERLAVRNTPWEQAKFEVPALRWADVCDGEYGVAVICTSRHGYTNWDSKLGLSLLKSPIYPNPWSDTGKGHFVYYLYPHTGDWYEGEVYKRAMEVWSPLRAVSTDSGSDVEREVSLLKFNAEFILKKGEDGDYVLRVFNPSRNSMEINLPFECTETDLLELERKECRRKVVLKPFEIKTLIFNGFNF